jgi:hypothetical protein
LPLPLLFQKKKPLQLCCLGGEEKLPKLGPTKWYLVPLPGDEKDISHSLMFGYEHARKQRASTWHFQKFSFASGDMANFSNFKQKFSFQISKMKMFDFFILNFKIDFLKKFHFPQVVWPIFFKI